MARGRRRETPCRLSGTSGIGDPGVQGCPASACSAFSPHVKWTQGGIGSAESKTGRGSDIPTIRGLHDRELA